uniref:Nucleoporin_N domain-containing protein n=1 Tax=Trichuris muris TaxID=70415 RepID=A0A5S6QMY6_TRIMR
MRLDAVGLDVPVHVAEFLASCDKQRSYSAISCRFSNTGDWISFVCNRQAYFWNLREPEVNCYCLPLPQSGLIYHADLLLILLPRNADFVRSVPGCIVISPEGVVRYWAKATQPSSYIEASIDVKNEVCKSLTLLPESRCCVLATSSGSAYLLPFPDESSKRLPLPIALTCHSQGTIAEVARRFSSIFVPPTRQEVYVNTVFPELSVRDGRLLLLVLSLSLRCWKVFSDLKYTFLWSYELKHESAFQIFDPFLAEQLGNQWISCSPPQKRVVSVKILDACLSGAAVAVLIEVRPFGNLPVFHVVSLFQCLESKPPEAPQLLFHVQGQPELASARLCGAELFPTGIMYTSKTVWNFYDSSRSELSTNDVIIGTGIIDNRIAVYLAKLGLTLVSFEDDSDLKHLTRDCMIRRLGIRSEMENDALLYSERPFDRFHAAFLYFLNHDSTSYRVALNRMASLTAANKQIVKFAYRLCGLILDTDEFVGTFSTGLDSDIEISTQLESKAKALELLSEFLKGVAWSFKSANLPTYRWLVKAYLALVEAAEVLCSSKLPEIVAEIVENAMRSLLKMNSDMCSYHKQIKEIFLQEVSDMRSFLGGFVRAESEILEDFPSQDRLLIWLKCTELINALVSPFQTGLTAEAKNILIHDSTLWEMRSSLLTTYVDNLLRPQTEHAVLAMREMASCGSNASRDELCAALTPLLDRTIRDLLELLTLAEQLAQDDPTGASDLHSFHNQNVVAVNGLLFKLLDVGMKDLCVQLAERYRVFPVLAKICAQTGDTQLFNHLIDGTQGNRFLEAVNEFCSGEATFGILHEYALKHAQVKPEMQHRWHADWLYYWCRREFALCLRSLLIVVENETESLQRQRVAISQATLVRQFVLNIDSKLENRLKAAQLLVNCQIFLGNVRRNVFVAQQHGEKPLTPHTIVEKYMEIAEDDESFYSEALYTMLRMVELGILCKTEEVVMDTWAKLLLATEWPAWGDPVVTSTAMRGTLFARTLQALIEKDCAKTLLQCLPDSTSRFENNERFRGGTLSPQIRRTIDEYLFAVRENLCA